MNVLDALGDQRRKLFTEIIRARNAPLLTALTQNEEPTQEQRAEVTKLLSDEFSLNLDESSEPNERGQEIDALLGEFLLRWPLLDSKVAKLVLLQALEGEAGLWELVWELNTLDPGGRASQHQERAAATVSEQAGRGWIKLFYANEPDGDLTPVAPTEIAEVLSNPRYWQEPSPVDRSVRISITPAGEVAYREMGGTKRRPT